MAWLLIYHHGTLKSNAIRTAPPMDNIINQVLIFLILAMKTFMQAELLKFTSSYYEVTVRHHTYLAGHSLHLLLMLKATASVIILYLATLL